MNGRQLLTLYITPVVCVYMDRLRLWFERRRHQLRRTVPEQSQGRWTGLKRGSRSKTVLIRAGIIDTFDVSRKPRLRSPETRADRPLVHRAVRYYRLSQASAWDLEPPGSTIGRDLQYGTISTVAPQQSIRASMPSIAPIVSPAAPLGTYLFWTLPETHRRHRSREYPFSDRPMCS